MDWLARISKVSPITSREGGHAEASWERIVLSPCSRRSRCWARGRDVGDHRSLVGQGHPYNFRGAHGPPKSKPWRSSRQLGSHRMRALKVRCRDRIVRRSRASSFERSSAARLEEHSLALHRASGSACSRLRRPTPVAVDDPTEIESCARGRIVHTRARRLVGEEWKDERASRTLQKALCARTRRPSSD